MEKKKFLNNEIRIRTIFEPLNKAICGQKHYCHKDTRGKIFSSPFNFRFAKRLKEICYRIYLLTYVDQH